MPQGSAAAVSIIAFAAAATSALTAKRRRVGITSARLSNADSAVPPTKPNWTMVVSHAASLLVRLHCVWYCADTALAANQSDMPSNSATAMTPS
ncbi:hypothetical protein [Gemmatimonas sp.]|uniref:hypothetical protein n=1 Tax=Gemmatimonas sp. TaxID=1962908 RepID=UPI003DA5E951